MTAIISGTDAYVPIEKLFEAREVIEKFLKDSLDDKQDALGYHYFTCRFCWGEGVAHELQEFVHSETCPCYKLQELVK